MKKVICRDSGKVIDGLYKSHEHSGIIYVKKGPDEHHRAEVMKAERLSSVEKRLDAIEDNINKILEHLKQSQNPR